LSSATTRAASETDLTHAFTRRDLVVGGGLLAAALASGLLAPSPVRRLPRGLSLDALVPMKVGPWTGSRYSDVLIPKGEDTENKTYDEVVTRYYRSDRAPAVMLLIAYGSAQTGGTELHRPEVCYPSAGFRVRSWPVTSLQLPGVSLPARPITARAAGRIEQILYWTRVGRDFPTSSLEQRLAVLRHSVRGSVPDGIIVRMSTMDVERERALRVLRFFAAALLTSGDAEMRRLLTGTA
jgi:EpsI family protein